MEMSASKLISRGQESRVDHQFRLLAVADVVKGKAN
jgi:hypothetical protein